MLPRRRFHPRPSRRRRGVLLRKSGVQAKAVGLWGSGLLTSDHYLRPDETSRTWLQKASTSSPLRSALVGVYLNQTTGRRTRTTRPAHRIEDLWSTEGQAMIRTRPSAFISILRSRSRVFLHRSHSDRDISNPDPTAWSASGTDTCPCSAREVPVANTASAGRKCERSARRDPSVVPRPSNNVRPQGDIHLTRFGAGPRGHRARRVRRQRRARESRGNRGARRRHRRARAHSATDAATGSSVVTALCTTSAGPPSCAVHEPAACAVTAASSGRLRRLPARASGSSPPTEPSRAWATRPRLALSASARTRRSSAQAARATDRHRGGHRPRAVADCRCGEVVPAISDPPGSNGTIVGIAATPTGRATARRSCR